jgi:Na+/melibiose symporter-like transporter
MSGAFLAMTTLSFFTMRVVQWVGQGNNQRGYQLGAVIFSVIALPCFMICFFTQKEVVKMTYRKTPYKKFIRILKGNTPTWLCFVAYLVQGISTGGMFARMYFFRYNVFDRSTGTMGNLILMANIATVSAIFSILGTMSLSWLVGKVKNKGSLPALSYLGSAIVSILNFFVAFRINTPVGLVLYIILGCCGAFSMGLNLSSMFGVMPDLNEYTAYHYGVTTSAGFLSSFINLAMKIGQAFSVAAVGWILAGLGYVANVDQPVAMQNAFNVMVHLFPGVCSIFAGIAMLNYKLDKKTHADLCEKLARNEYAPGVVLDEELT